LYVLTVKLTGGACITGTFQARFIGNQAHQRLQLTLGTALNFALHGTQPLALRSFGLMEHKKLTNLALTLATTTSTPYT
jgi:hypothetical protein